VRVVRNLILDILFSTPGFTVGQRGLTDFETQDREWIHTGVVNEESEAIDEQAHIVLFP
jgi:hypothetical protein